MSRTTEDKVRKIINLPTDLDVDPFIDAASSLVDVVVTRAGSLLNSTQATIVETWLAAHFAGIRDQLYQSKTTEKAQATFQGKTDMGLDSTLYGQMAKRLDTSGVLALLDAQAKAGGRKVVAIAWLGQDADVPPDRMPTY